MPSAAGIPQEEMMKRKIKNLCFTFCELISAQDVERDRLSRQVERVGRSQLHSGILLTAKFLVQLPHFGLAQRLTRVHVQSAGHG